MPNQLIKANERTALITAIGIILGFALAFFTTWSLTDTSPEIPVILVAQDIEAARTLQDNLSKKTPEDANQKIFGWDRQDLFPLGGLLLGIGILMRSLFRSLTPPDQDVKYYNQTIRIFMWGIFVVLVSATVSLFSQEFPNLRNLPRESWKEVMSYPANPPSFGYDATNKTCRELDDLARVVNQKIPSTNTPEFGNSYET